MSGPPSRLCLRREPFADGSVQRVIDGSGARVRVVSEWDRVCFRGVAYSGEGISETSVPASKHDHKHLQDEA